jgi:hypothetical protein
MRKFCLAMLCVLALTGCTSTANNGNGIASVDGGAPSAMASQRDDPAAFAQCMQSHGQDVAAPAGPDDRFDFDPRPQNPPPGFDEAMRACQQFIPLMTKDKGPTPEEMEKLRDFAVCMRAHDIPITDPQVGGDRPGNMRIGGRFEDVTRAQLEADPVYQAAMEACKDKLPDQTSKG